MNKAVFYRNISVLGGAFLLLNVLVLNKSQQFFNLSFFIDLLILPATLISTSVWVGKNISLLSLFIFFIGYSLNLKLHYNDELAKLIPPKLGSVFYLTGMFLMLFAIFSNLHKGWLMKENSKAEFLAILIPAITLLFVYCGLSFY